jgi:serine/threonine protein kinase
MTDNATKGSRANKKTMVATGPLPPPPAASNPAIPKPPELGARAQTLAPPKIKSNPTPPHKPPTVPIPPTKTPAQPIARAAAPGPTAAPEVAAPKPVPVSRSSELPNTPTVYSAPTQRISDEKPPAGPPDSHSSRESKVGSHLAGTEGLVEAGGDSHRLRLQAGKAVPGTRYRLKRWLGEGGMGVVYEAEHMDIERRVALKILRFDLSQQAHMAQVFRDEARAASRVGSKYIVEIFDFGELPDGRLWFCMEMLEGTDLVPETETETVDSPTLIELLRMTCKGLYEAHTQGIVHRDIKPENILTVKAEDGRDTVKIVDFGISALLAAGQQGASIAGTPHYMPPEQVLGQAFDGRCDMYALGCMAFELLTGRPPFIADDLDTLLDMQVNADPPTVEEVRSDIQVPPELSAVIMKCLAKHPDDRYADMADLEAALCEAQIAAGLTTQWDDLPLPNVDEERRSFLIDNMPSPTIIVEDKRPAWVIPAVAIGSALAAGLLAFAIFGGGPTEDEMAGIETLTAEARTAGSRMNYIYPPQDDHDGATSYLKVVELEAQEGKLDDPGDERAEELRAEFSNTLTEMGNRFWDSDITKGIARDYYWQAAMFDDNNTVAFERAGVTPGLLAQMRQKAASGSFSDEELRTANQLGYLAMVEQGGEVDPEREAVLFGDDGDGSAIMSNSMRRAARAKGVKAVGAAPKGEPDIPPPPTEDVVPSEDGGNTAEGESGEDPDALVLEEIAGDRPSINSGRGRGKKKYKGGDAGLGKGKRDPGKAKALADEGAAALRAGRRSEAASLFNQAISYDRSNAKALMGLSDVYFDTGKSQKAVLYAERAVKAASKNSSYRLKLGDAYYKVLRYRDALEQYEKAKGMGSKKAESRISKVKAKIGG